MAIEPGRGSREDRIGQARGQHADGCPAAELDPRGIGRLSRAQASLKLGLSPSSAPTTAPPTHPAEMLAAREPASTPILDVLAARTILDDTFNYSGRSVATMLHDVLTTPRVDGLSGRHVYWSLLERLYNPASTTQRVNVAFDDGSFQASTCVGAARIVKTILSFPGEYVRMTEEVSSRACRFHTVRRYDEEGYRRKIAWLSGAFEYDELGDGLLRIWVVPDRMAAARAREEQENRLFDDYDFGRRTVEGKPVGNTRLAVDVLLQSAFTNYVFRGDYSSSGEVERSTGARGASPDMPGYAALDEDVMMSHHPGNPRNALPRVPPGTPVDPRWGLPIVDPSVDPLYAYTQGHHLRQPLAFVVEDR